METSTSPKNEKSVTDLSFGTHGPLRNRIDRQEIVHLPLANATIHSRLRDLDLLEQFRMTVEDFEQLDEGQWGLGLAVLVA
jgi:hypothetical protein